MILCSILYIRAFKPRISQIRLKIFAKCNDVQGQKIVISSEMVLFERCVEMIYSSIQINKTILESKTIDYHSQNCISFVCLPNLQSPSEV